MGNIEPKNLMDGEVDVVVCDGFVGNVILKFGEGLTSIIFKMIKEKVQKNLLATIGAIFMLPTFKSLKRKIDSDEFGGTLLLGIKKGVIITHGSASPKALCNGILEAAKVVREGVIDKIEDILSKG